MLRPIPAKIMRSTATVKACTGKDRYQNPVYSEYTVQRVHVQPSNQIIKTANNTDCVLRSVLFADDRNSSPALNWWALFATAERNSGDVKVIIRGVEYTVAAVEELRDDTDEFHHWEIGLV